MDKNKADEKVFIVCPVCGYLVDVKYPTPARSNGNKKCENCGSKVGWSIYENRVFPYIKDKK